MTELCDLCVKYGTDKVIWGYTPHYHEQFQLRRTNVKNVLEIGICGHRDIPNNIIGASLHVWRDYFPNAEVIGLDNEAKWMVNKPRIHSYCIDAYQVGEMTHLMDVLGRKFDFICDDAVHDPFPQIQLFKTLEPYLAKDGVYAIEDVCPYKMDGSVNPILSNFPDFNCKEVRTHKDERLLLFTRKPSGAAEEAVNPSLASAS